MFGGYSLRNTFLANFEWIMVIVSMFYHFDNYN